MSDNFEMTCQNMVDNIAKELQKYYDGFDDEISELEDKIETLEDNMPKEPDQKEDESDEEYDVRYAEWEKAYDEAQQEIDELQEKLDEFKNEGDLNSYFDDYLDVDYIVNCNKEYQAARIWVTVGGPGIYIDTEDAAVKLTWGSTKAEAYLGYNLRDAIDDIFREIYEIS